VHFIIKHGKADERRIEVAHMRSLCPLVYVTRRYHTRNEGIHQLQICKKFYMARAYTGISLYYIPVSSLEVGPN
jgi:hypothetical protein